MKAATLKNPTPSLEIALAVVLSLWVAVLHLLCLTHAGPLWRDEAEAIGFATMPSLTETFQSLHYGNFPPLFAIVARCWTAAGLGHDTGYRTLGFLIGLGTLGAVWFGARALGAKAPLLALALFAANPVTVRICDSMRSYGLGIILLLLTQSLIWKYVNAPRRFILVTAMLTAILSVQCLYQSAWFIAAFCAGAWIVTLARKQWNSAAGVGIIGAAAALSLLPDVGNIARIGEWMDITQVSLDFHWIKDSMSAAVKTAGPWTFPLCLASAATALAATCAIGWRLRAWNMIYAVVGLWAGAIFYLGFLYHIQLPPRVWYAPILLAPSALAMEAAIAAIPLAAAQWARAALAVTAVMLGAAQCRDGVMLRQSNADVVALKLKAAAQPGDLVVISPWYYGLSLRCYMDENAWMSVPPISDFRVHRYDLLKEQMTTLHPLAPLEEQIRRTLREGHAVWVAGKYLPQSPSSPPLVELPPYHGQIKMADSEYCDHWARQMSEFIHTNAVETAGVPVPVPGGARINPFEILSLNVARGWRGP